MRRHQRTHVGTHEVVNQWMGKQWHQENERECRRNGCRADATRSAGPERPRLPGLSTAELWPRSVDCAFLIERAHDPSAQLWRSPRIRQVPTQRRARPFKILQQRTALGAVLHVPFNVGRAERIDLAVEVSLQAKRFSARHAALPRSLAAIAPSARPVRAPGATSPYQWVRS